MNCNTATRNKFACLFLRKTRKNVSSRFVDRNEKIVPCNVNEKRRNLRPNWATKIT